MRSKVLEEFPLYRIYEDGTLISYVRNKPYKIKWGLDKQGYLKTNIFDYNKNRKKVSQHRMLAMAFVPNTENKNTVNHINGAKDDNRLENLEWLTQKENDRHSRDVLGNDWVGEKHPASRYSNKEIKQVIDKLNEGLANKEIIQLLPWVKIETLHEIRRKKRWGAYKINNRDLLVKGNRNINHYQILDVIDKINSGMSATEINNETGISINTIYAIRSKSNYKDYNHLLNIKEK